ncbi:AraC family transcriptional regulator [Undibacterium baiyunense]|nr:AraC family transcriptional regulator [Undibacterium baiyunense]
MTWSQRMNLAIEYIENNLESALHVENIATVACCSKYHFHRMFFANFKVTCAEYVRSRKLSLAAIELMSTNKSVLDIALKYGYESPNAFARAFRKMHGINPSQARRSSTTLSTYDRVYFPLRNQIGENMNYKIITISDFQIFGKSKEFEFEEFLKSGSKFWKEYVNSENYRKLGDLHQGRPGSKTNAPMLSAYFPKENGNRNEFIDVLGIEAIDILETDGFEFHSVPSATYAEFFCTYKTSMQTNRYIYGDWFATTAYERDGNKPDIVSYFPIPFRPMSEMRVRWWVPVISKKK